MSKKSLISQYAPYLSLGLEIAVAIALPILAGYWADEYFGTSPWLLLGGCVIGIINVFVVIFQLSKKLDDNA